MDEGKKSIVGSTRLPWNESMDTECLIEPITDHPKMRYGKLSFLSPDIFLD